MSHLKVINILNRVGELLNVICLLVTVVKPADVNGGYSMWSQWTECSVSCGGGTRARERTCTDPPPAGNGQGCEHLGDPEEEENCNEDPCLDRKLPLVIRSGLLC